ncbi:MAG TPA: hypothetical protein VFH06_00630 [Candidatus Saccharimonadales bacterium]|nr:hypothetical protein [Candidatus Saccharimonadales bacterium]
MPLLSHHPGRMRDGEKGEEAEKAVSPTDGLARSAMDTISGMPGGGWETIR